MAIFIALDVGTKTIGLARAEAHQGMATPWTTLARKGVNKDVVRLLQLLRGQEIAGFVVGLPVEADGAEGRSARLARQVGDALAAATELPIHYQDESFSTREAAHRLYEAGYGDRRQRPIIDQAAAAVILQDWLDRTGRAAGS